VEESIPTAQIEQLVVKLIESRLQQAIEEYVERNELRMKELSLIDRTVRVEEELRSLREMSESKFESLQREMNVRFDAVYQRFEVMDQRFEVMDKRFEVMDQRFEAMDKRFEALQREMNVRFDANEKRFEALQREMNARFETVDMRFESLQREMNTRFEAMDKRFSTTQWMIGILVGIPAIAMTIIQLVKIL
jgi:chaperonin cofactor prefoldin